ncbi:ACHA-like protein [Mya arenaria]|uniref:ACHA-like protein n=1 Tax=Mya arenaria TaxID=6604 RepID=A0ABY7E445_MYAAR|nr:ACHA-like protein [Mya arenaria]
MCDVNSNYLAAIGEEQGNIFDGKVSVIVAALIEAQTANETKALITKLLAEYNKDVRPVTYQKESIKLAGYLLIIWSDEFLTWTPTDYGGIDTIFLPQDDIWRPDAALQNAFKEVTDLGSKYLKVQIDSKGLVVWAPYQIFHSTCDVNIKYFPFDVQECQITITAWSYTDEYVRIDINEDDPIDHFLYKENAMWTLIDTSAEAYGPTVIFKIKMKRKPNHVVINILVPLLLLSFLAVLTFVLPVTSGERASYAVTIFLSVAVFLTILSSELPSSSDNVPILSIYLAILCFDTTAIVVVTLLQLRLLTRDESDQPVNGCFKIIYSITMAIRCKTGGKKRGHSNNNENNGVDVMTKTLSWLEVVNALDFLFFWFFLFCTVAVTTYYFVICTTNQSDEENLQEIGNF